MVTLWLMRQYNCSVFLVVSVPPKKNHFLVSSFCRVRISPICKNSLQEPFYAGRSANKSVFLMSYVLSKRNLMCLCVGLKVSIYGTLSPLAPLASFVPHSALGYLCTGGANGFRIAFPAGGRATCRARTCRVLPTHRIRRRAP
jgi:hypothetical protein